MNAHVPLETAAAPRVDLYGLVHKGLRRALADAMASVGAADLADAAAAARALAAVRTAASLCRAHATAETTHIHPALDAVRPGAPRAFDEEHRAHDVALDAIEGAVARVEQATAAMRPAAGQGLYAAFARFVGESLLHMAAEESVLMPQLAAAFGDGELRALQGRIVGSLGADGLAAFLVHILPATAPEERVALLRGLRLNAPGPVWAASWNAARRSLSPAACAALATALGLPEAGLPERVVLIMDFPFDGPWGAALADAMRPIAAEIAAAEGLVWKIWTEDPAGRRAGGIYLFESDVAAERYRAAHFARLAAFGITGVAVRRYRPNAALSAQTAAPLRADCP